MITIVVADYADQAQADAVRRLLTTYAGQTLPASLIGALSAHRGAFSLLARSGADFVGVANCFEGFSTFVAKPLINVHDIFVDPAWRGQGVASLLLASVEQMARDRGCCAVTLEVLKDNAAAQAVYSRSGFGGDYLFWKKTLP